MAKEFNNDNSDIFRRVKRRGFTQIDNEPINDPDLRFEDIGLLVYVMSKPDTWTIYKSNLESSHGNGRESIRSIFGRLQAKGYLKILEHRDDKGRFKHKEYIFTDIPYDFGEKLPIDGNPSMDEKAGKYVDLSMNGKPSMDVVHERETVNRKPSPNNTIYNNTLIAAAEDESPNETSINQVKTIFNRILNRSIDNDLAKVLAGYSIEEVETVAYTLQNRLEEGKITNPIGLLKKDPVDVIANILNGGLYSSKPIKHTTDRGEYTAEIEEFEQLTGLQMKGAARENKYIAWRKKFNKDVVFKAGEIMALRTNGSLEYIDRILNDWEGQKVTSITDIKYRKGTKKTMDDYEIYIPPSQV